MVAAKKDAPETEDKPSSTSVLQMHRDPLGDDHQDPEVRDEGAGAQEQQGSSGAASHPPAESSRPAEESASVSDGNPVSQARWRPGREPQTPSVAEEIGEGLKPHYAPLLAALEEKCRQLFQTAESDAEQIRQSAEQYRAGVVAEAHRASEAIRAAAERERDGILEAASDEISHWLDEFEQECHRWAAGNRPSAGHSEPESPGGTAPITPPR